MIKSNKFKELQDVPGKSSWKQDLQCSYPPSGLVTVRVSVIQSPAKLLSVARAVLETVPGPANTKVVNSILSLQTSEFALQKV